METPANIAGAKEFQVTGVSRSGRVRKKSSKLLDFQSPDELEKKPKRSARAATRGTRGRSLQNDATWKQSSVEGPLTAFDDDVATDDDDADFIQNAAFLEGHHADGEVNRSLTSLMASDDDDDEDELDELVADIVEGVEAENAIDTKVRQSLYMTEKANKKKILKDGRVVTGKIQRKDKGKSRFTAYSLWAREFRKSSKFSTKQDLDFVNSARRLSELWANVPNNEKNIWRRKAKRLAYKSNQEELLASSNNASDAAAANSLFLNRATTSRTKKLAAEKEKPLQECRQKASRASAAATTPSKRGRKDVAEKYSLPTNNAFTPTSAHHKRNNTNNASSLSQSNSTLSSLKQSHIKLPLSGIEPIDAAAHLKLLGESLSIIGERLKEHEGQITVSGSLSVLLDSLLCSLGPLLCLTTRLPGLEKRKELSENLTATLDNIAYVMPGL